MALAVEVLGSGSPPLVLVHGFTQTGRSWGALAADLARDHEVRLVDAPGHGGSATIAADLPTGAGLLGAAGGPGVYVGYSMGARLCLHLALAEPGLVTGLVLLGGTAGIDDEGERTARRAADEALAQSLEREGLEPFLDRWLAGPLFAGLPADAAQRQDRLRNTVDGLAASLRRSGTGTQVPSWDVLHRLAMPVLVLAGERDEKFTALGRRMTTAIGGNATFATVAGAGHAAHLEQGDVFRSVLRHWLVGHGW